MGWAIFSWQDAVDPFSQRKLRTPNQPHTHFEPFHCSLFVVFPFLFVRLSSDTPLSSIRLVLLPSSTSQTFTFQSALGSTRITLDELLSEQAEKTGFPIVPLHDKQQELPAPQKFETQSAIVGPDSNDQTMNQLQPNSPSSSSSVANHAALSNHQAMLRLQVATGVGSVLSRSRDGHRTIIGRDVSQYRGPAAPTGMKASDLNGQIHHQDLKFSAQPDFDFVASNQQLEQESNAFELTVGVHHLPSLDPLLDPAPVVALFTSEGRLLTHTEVGHGHTCSYSTKLLAPMDAVPVRMRVYDASEDMLEEQHSLGETEAIEKQQLNDAVTSSQPLTLPLHSTNNVGLNKKLLKRSAQIYATIRAIGGVAASSPMASSEEHVRLESLIFFDSHGREHPSVKVESPNNANGSYEVSLTALPKLDPLATTRTVLACLWRIDGPDSETLVGHTEVSTSSNPTFRTPIHASTEAAYRLDVHDLLDERVDERSKIGSAVIDGKELTTLTSDDIELSYDLTSIQPVLAKKLAKRAAKVYLGRAGSAADAIERRVQARGAIAPSPMASPVASPVAAKAAEPEEVKEEVKEVEPVVEAVPVEDKVAPSEDNEVARAVAAALASVEAVPATVVVVDPEASSLPDSTPKSPQHIAEAEAINDEAAAVANEIAANQRLSEAEKKLSSLKPGKKDSKATLMWQQAEKELREAREAHELATKRAAEARANLAIKRAARIAEEDRLKREAEEARRANPNMTLWGERKRGHSMVFDIDTSSNAHIDQIALARRAQAFSSGSSSAAPYTGGRLTLFQINVTGIKSIGAWKPIIGVYDGETYLDHTEKLDGVGEDGAVTFTKPMLIEDHSAPATTDAGTDQPAPVSKQLGLHLFNVSGDIGTSSDIIASACVDSKTLDELSPMNELVLPLHSTNKIVNDRLKRQEASIVINVTQRSTNKTGGSLIAAKTPLPTVLPVSIAAKDANMDEPRVRRSSISNIAQPDEVNATNPLETTGQPIEMTATNAEIAPLEPAEVEVTDVPSVGVPPVASSSVSSNDAATAAGVDNATASNTTESAPTLPPQPFAGLTTEPVVADNSVVEPSTAVPSIAEATAASPIVDPSLAESTAASPVVDPSLGAATASPILPADSSSKVVGPGMKMCSSCNTVKSKAQDFSAAQAKKPEGRCKVCVNA